MEPIRVPRPPKEAFNKHRRVSDLIRKQVHHFKHLEQKLPEQLRREIPQHPVVTEDDAARYISHMTRLLLQGSQAPTDIAAKQPQRRGRGLALAAAEDPSGKPATRERKAVASPRKGKKR